MIIYFWNSLMVEIVIKPEATENHKAIGRDNGNIVKCTGNIRNYFTLVLDFGGCETTSADHGQGKLLVMKLLEKSKAASRKTGLFLLKGKTLEAIYEAAKRIFVIKLYCGKDSDSLTDLRYLKYVNIKP